MKECTKFPGRWDAWGRLWSRWHALFCPVCRRAWKVDRNIERGFQALREEPIAGDPEAEARLLAALGLLPDTTASSAPSRPDRKSPLRLRFRGSSLRLAVAALLAACALLTVTTGAPVEALDRVVNAVAQVLRIGAEWQQGDLLSQTEYVRLRAIKDTAVERHAVSDQELDWLLGTLQQAREPIVRARVLGVLSLLENAPAPQKDRIKAAIAPLLQSPHKLDRNYAIKVARNLGFAR